MNMTDADLEQRRAALAAKQQAMKQQMMQEGTHLFCGKRYYNSSHGSVVLKSFLAKTDGQDHPH